jgi:hypothetical protein
VLLVVGDVVDGRVVVGDVVDGREVVGLAVDGWLVVGDVVVGRHVVQCVHVGWGHRAFAFGAKLGATRTSVATRLWLVSRAKLACAL